MTRRIWIPVAALAALTTFAATLPADDAKPKKRLLVFTRSQGFQHDVVKLNKDGTCLVHEVMTALGAKHNFDVECTKDGRMLAADHLAKFDAFFFYTTGDLTAEQGTDGTPPMAKEDKKALLDAIANGKGFIGSHCASDTFHSKADARKSQSPQEMDPYIAMLGGEFISHGAQQPSTMRVIDAAFPGLKGVKDFTMTEEWYSLKNFPKDLHVILAQDTGGMKGVDYERPKFPATWARQHGKGRVFYTSMGHRDDVWKNPLFQNLIVGAVDWTTRRINVDIPPNIEAVTPQAAIMPPPPPPKPPANKKK